MQLVLPDINKIVEQNRLPEVTNPVYLDGSNTPTSDGIFSYELFGRPGSAKRKFQFGYIDLGKPFIQPLAYVQMAKLFSKLPDIINGTKNFVIGKDGILIEDQEKGGTGIEWLYKNFERINFDDRGTASRKKKIEIFTAYSKDEIFTSKWLIIPPFYFDINLRSAEGARSIDELGSLYIKLLSMSKILKNEGAFFTAYSMEYTIQDTLVQIYKLLSNKIAMKTGLIHSSILGKNIDYTVRGVISTPIIRKANSYREQQVPYGYVGVPLYMVATAMFPFMISELEKFMQSMNAYKVLISNSAGHEIIEDTIDNISSTNYEKLIKLYAKSPENRMQEFKVETPDGANALASFEKFLGRPFTITDLLFIAASECVKDKFVLFTRYPITDYRSICPYKTTILTTEATCHMRLLDSDRFDYRFYPDFSKKPISWIDSIRPHFSYLTGFGADFDGDTMSLKYVYSQEANLELAKNFYNPMLFLDPNGGDSRGLIKDSILSLYEMTK